MPYLNFYSTRPIAKFIITIISIITIGIIVLYTGMLFSRLIFWLHLDQVNDVLYGRYDLLSVAQLKYYQAVQTIGFFIVPGIFLYWIFSEDKHTYFEIIRKPKILNCLLILLVLLIATPLIQWLFIKNQSITLPDFMSGLEESLQKMDQKHEILSNRFLQGNTLVQYLSNILIIALLPAIGEELIFRGLIQQIFIDSFRKWHVGIILTALLFSAIHGQFYSFIPRFVVGLFFGYLMFWSKSIWYPVLAHFLSNTLMLTIAFISEKSTGSLINVQNSMIGGFYISWIGVTGSLLISSLLIFFLRRRFVLSRSSNG